MDTAHKRFDIDMEVLCFLPFHKRHAAPLFLIARDTGLMSGSAVRKCLANIVRMGIDIAITTDPNDQKGACAFIGTDGRKLAMQLALGYWRGVYGTKDGLRKLKITSGLTIVNK